MEIAFTRLEGNKNMKIQLEVDVDRADENIFMQSMAYFIWNNPAAMSVDKIRVDDKDINFNTFCHQYKNSSNISIQRIEEFKFLILNS